MNKPCFCYGPRNEQLNWAYVFFTTRGDQGHAEELESPYHGRGRTSLATLEHEFDTDSFQLTFMAAKSFGKGQRHLI